MHSDPNKSIHRKLCEKEINGENRPVLYIANIKAKVAKVAQPFLLNLKEVDRMVVDEKETNAALKSSTGVRTDEIVLE